MKITSALFLSAITLLPAAASASEPWSPSVGVRVGGYGFRHADGGDLDWEDCRMDGAGVYAQLTRNSPLYAQLSFDAYHATGETVASGMDRLSLTTLASAGVRLENRTPIWPHIELGVGAEWTSVDVNGLEDRRVLPVAVLGTGVEVAIRRVRLGATLRVMGSGLPEHGHGPYEPAAAKHDHGTDGESETIRYELEIAGQATFAMRYEF